MNHALPLVHRTPTDRLLHAREDHERCLRLAASYRVRLARGETEMRELHTWALNHARTLRRRGRGPDKGPRIRAGGEGYPRLRRAGRKYVDTTIAFTPRSMAEGFRSTVGQIKLGPHPDTTGWSEAYALHIGGPEVTTRFPSKAEIDALVLRDFHLLVAEHGMKPVVVHNALLELIEFRRAIHETAYGSVNQGKPRDTNAADRPL